MIWVLVGKISAESGEEAIRLARDWPQFRLAKGLARFPAVAPTSALPFPNDPLYRYTRQEINRHWRRL